MALNMFLAAKQFAEENKNPLFLDIGANIGLFTFFIARYGCECHAFEPHPYYGKVLKNRASCLFVERLFKGGIAKVIINKIGLSNEKGNDNSILFH